jgi:hypothetical protein
MTERPKIELSRLREIGWAQWDPIDLKHLSDGEWQDGGACADEYDTYLMQVAGRLLTGATASEVIAYLEDIEAGNMGLGHTASTRPRAEATVAAIIAYLATLPARD